MAGPGGIAPPSRGSEPRALLLDQGPRMVGYLRFELRSTCSQGTCFPIKLIPRGVGGTRTRSKGPQPFALTIELPTQQIGRGPGYRALPDRLVRAVCALRAPYGCGPASRHAPSSIRPQLEWHRYPDSNRNDRAENAADSPLSDSGFDWWTLSGSNRLPPACKAGALPSELRAHELVTIWRGRRGMNPHLPR
jgi:hypothetical protein